MLRVSAPWFLYFKICQSGHKYLLQVTPCYPHAQMVREGFLRSEGNNTEALFLFWVEARDSGFAVF